MEDRCAFAEVVTLLLHLDGAQRISVEQPFLQMSTSQQLTVESSKYMSSSGEPM